MSEQEPQAKATPELAPLLMDPEAGPKLGSGTGFQGCRKSLLIFAILGTLGLIMLFSSEIELLESGFERAADTSRARLEREAKFNLKTPEYERLTAAFRDWSLARERALDKDARNAWNTSLVGTSGRILDDSRVSKQELRELTAYLERSIAAGEPEIPGSSSE